MPDRILTTHVGSLIRPPALIAFWRDIEGGKPYDEAFFEACLAESVAGTGVTVNAVLPGPTRSEGLEGWFRPAAEARGVAMEVLEKEFLDAMRPTSLIRRFATTEEVANMVVYVCSEQASATTGAALRVDGGVVRFVA